MEELREDDPGRIGPYEIVGLIGSGGMGRVYLGRSADGAQAAVKVIHADLARDPEFRTRFGREVAATRSVTGPFVAAVVDSDTEADRPWLATEHVSAESLQAMIASGERLGLDAVRTLGTDLAAALGAIHAAGLVHRDVKPSNILMAPSGPKLIDFGIARDLAATQMTRTGFSLGTPQYMAPEQIAGDDGIGPAADVFALAVVLVFAATGKFAFGEGTPAQLHFRIERGEAAALDGIGDADLRGLLRRCLSYLPADRPSVDEVGAALGGLALGDVAAVEAAPVSPSQERTDDTHYSQNVVSSTEPPRTTGSALLPAADADGATELPRLSDSALLSAADANGATELPRFIDASRNPPAATPARSWRRPAAVGGVVAALIVVFAIVLSDSPAGGGTSRAAGSGGGASGGVTASGPAAGAPVPTGSDASQPTALDGSPTPSASAPTPSVTTPTPSGAASSKSASAPSSASSSPHASAGGPIMNPSSSSMAGNLPPTRPATSASSPALPPTTTTAACPPTSATPCQAAAQNPAPQAVQYQGSECLGVSGGSPDLVATCKDASTKWRVRSGDRSSAVQLESLAAPGKCLFVAGSAAAVLHPCNQTEAGQWLRQIAIGGTPTLSDYPGGSKCLRPGFPFGGLSYDTCVNGPPIGNYDWAIKAW